MENVVLVIHLFLALAIIGLVLIQRSEGGGLGIGGGNGGLGGLSTPGGTADALTKATGYCAAGFFCTSILLGILAGAHSQNTQSILNALDDAKAPAAVEKVIDNAAAPAVPVAPSPETPSVPIK